MFEDKKWDNIFKKRLTRHYDEMKWLYSELYHNDQQAFDYFCDMMYEYYQQRSPLLKEWDEAREASPDWYKGNDSWRTPRRGTGRGNWMSRAPPSPSCSTWMETNLPWILRTRRRRVYPSRSKGRPSGASPSRFLP